MSGIYYRCSPILSPLVGTMPRKRSGKEQWLPVGLEVEVQRVQDRSLEVQQGHLEERVWSLEMMDTEVMEKVKMERTRVYPGLSGE